MPRRCRSLKAEQACDSIPTVELSSGMDKVSSGKEESTSVLLSVVIGLLAVHSFTLFVTRRLSGPDHQRRVPATHRQQHRVIVRPADVGHIGAVTHILLKLCKLALMPRQEDQK